MTDRPAIYCGTYAKYNAGSIAGRWLNLEDYSNADAFLAACLELHKDEHDPELMFQDFQNFPKAFYSESPDKERLERLYAWLELDDDDRELLTVYQEHVNDAGDIDAAREAFAGKGYETEAAWAADFLEETGALAEIPEDLARYFDYESYARDARLGGDVTFVRHNGELWVFRNN